MKLGSFLSASGDTEALDVITPEQKQIPYKSLK